jgi:hypothetical protein
LKADDVWHQDTVSPEKDDGCGGTRNSDRGIWASPDVRDPSDEDRNGCFLDLNDTLTVARPDTPWLLLNMDVVEDPVPVLKFSLDSGQFSGSRTVEGRVLGRQCVSACGLPIVFCL